MLGAALATCVDGAVLARLGGPVGDEARAAAEALARLAPAARRAQRASWVATARAPLPPGLRGAHASWIEHALDGQPARARGDVARGGGDAVAVWLIRRALAELPPLPAADLDGPPGSLADALRLPADALLRWLTEIGADQLAYAIGAAGGAPPPDPRLRVAAIRIAQAPRVGALGPVRAAIARCRGAAEPALIRIAARTLAPHTNALARRQLAVRLPRAIGALVLAELHTHAHAARDATASWAALAAP